MTRLPGSTSTRAPRFDEPLSLVAAEKAEDHLKHFCEAVLELLSAKTASSSVLAQVLPTLVRAIGEGSHETVSELRREIRAWEAACEPLRTLAQSPFLQFGDEAARLLAKLEKTQAQALHVVEALEALQLATPHAGDAAPYEPERAEADDFSGRMPIVKFSARLSEPSLPSESEVHEDANEYSPSVPEDASNRSSHFRWPIEADARSEANALKEDLGPAELSDAERAAALYEEAEEYRRQQDFPSAEELYARALELDPDLRLAYLHRGRIRVLQGRADLAVEDLTNALRLHGGDAVASWWRGDAHSLAGWYAEAVEDYSRSLELRPDLILVRYNRAVALRLLGELDRSMMEFDQLVQFKPAHGPLYLNRGLIFLARGRLKRAVDEFRTALQHQPDSQEALQRLQETKSLLQQQTVEETARPATEEPLGEPPAPTTPGPVPLTSTVPSAPDRTDGSSPLSAVALEIRSKPPNGPPPIPAGSGDNRTRSKSNLEFQCPGCGKTSKVTWDKLQLGKALGCPNCRRSFTTKLDGRLVEVVKDKQGRWVDTEWKAARDRLVRSKRYKLIAATLAISICAYALSWTPTILRGLSPVEVKLPDELEPRAELFARAWLNRDMPLMRKLTDPVQDRLLFSWYRRNQPPAASDLATNPEDLKVEVEALPSKPPLALLRVRFDGLPSGPGGSPVVLRLAWEERGGNWIFQPAPNLQTRAGR